MKAEGGDVQNHPVVSQLVWLRQLDEHLKPLDQRLGKKLKKLLRQLKLLRSQRSQKAPDAAPLSEAKVAPVEVKVEKPKVLSLAERLEKLRGKAM